MKQRNNTQTHEQTYEHTNQPNQPISYKQNQRKPVIEEKKLPLYRGNSAGGRNGIARGVGPGRLVVTRDAGRRGAHAGAEKRCRGRAGDRELPCAGSCGRHAEGSSRRGTHSGYLLEESERRDSEQLQDTSRVFL